MRAGRRVAGILGALLLWGLVFATTARAEDTPAEASAGALERHGLWAEFEHARQQVFGDIGGDKLWYWDNGPELATPKRRLTLHLGGEVQLDTIWYSNPGPEIKTATGSSWESGIQFRRARLLVEGTLLEHFYFRLRYDMSPNAFANFQDAYIEWMGLVDRFGSIAPRFRIGQTREPIGLDALSSSKFITFMERAMAVQAIAPLRNIGVRAMASLKSERATFWLGAFDLSAGNLADADWSGGKAVSTRMTWLPWAPKGCGCRFLHLGLSASWRFDIGTARYQALPGTQLGGNVVDTGDVNASDAEITAAEIAFVYDRFSVQGEYLATRVASDQGAEAYLHGGYAQVSWFLTPPCRRFVRRTAVFGRVTPCRDVFEEGGRGAWEVAARISHVDLDDAWISGGTATAATFALNWYPSAYTRVMLNYVITDVEDAFGDPTGDGTFHAIGLRFQIDS